MHQFTIEFPQPAETYTRHLPSLQQHGFKVKGDDRAGEITGRGITARYTISDRTALIELTKSKFNPLPYSKIEKEIRALFLSI